MNEITLNEFLKLVAKNTISKVNKEEEEKLLSFYSKNCNNDIVRKLFEKGFKL